MNKFRAFIVGVVFGSFLIAGVGYATDRMLIEVQFPEIPYIFDGKELKLEQSEDQSKDAEAGYYPSTIHYNGINYVPVRKFAEQLGLEVTWDEVSKRVIIESHENLTYEEVPLEQAAPNIQAWVNRSLVAELAQSKVVQGTTYLLLTLGEKSSGGYEIQIEDIKQYHDRVVVTVNTTAPNKDDFVTEDITHPFKLVKLHGRPKGHFEFIHTSGSAIPVIEGVSNLPPLFEETEHMLLFDPVFTGDAIKLHGAVNTFEGVVEYSIVDPNDNVIENASIQAEGMNPNWGYFTKEISLDPSLLSQDISLMLYTDVHDDHDQEGLDKDSIKINLNAMTRAD